MGTADEMSNFVYRKRRATLRTVLVRISALILMIIIISSIVYLDRNGYSDSTDDRISLLDAIYFTVVSITTTGYGDITPVSTVARLIDTVFITLGRAAMWFVIVGTAYQFIFDRYREAYLMKAIQKSLSGHVIIAGYSDTGRSAAKELMAQGRKKKHIMVITIDKEEAQEAAESGYVSMIGDATREKDLEKAVISKASSIIITTSKDATNVLVALTARYLNPEIRIISKVMDLENAKLLEKSGVDVMIAPAVTSGNLMATATTQPNVVHLLEDMMTAGKGLFICERVVQSDEVGVLPKKLKGISMIGVARQGKVYTMGELDSLKLRKGDRLLCLKSK
ncbi:MAG: potassium channel family protein [Candidatus Thermoplasmatota archaeon]|nr:potassium channel family protein [Candidatus Thermoplasmatota archaeon]